MKTLIREVNIRCHSYGVKINLSEVCASDAKKGCPYNILFMGSKLNSLSVK